MKDMRRFRSVRPLVVAVLSVVAVVVLFVLLRPESETTRTNQTTTSARPSTGSATTARPPPAPIRTRVTMAVRGGRVVGGIRRVTLSRGAHVELVITCDVADEVHLHGYDLSRNVAPGASARLLFTATTSGRFEVELEQRGLQIAEITVR
jgi:uncharacterized cupredoxin-like copper-binding protein